MNNAAAFFSQPFPLPCGFKRLFRVCLRRAWAAGKADASSATALDRAPVELARPRTQQSACVRVCVSTGAQRGRQFWAVVFLIYLLHSDSKSIPTIPH